MVQRHPLLAALSALVYPFRPAGAPPAVGVMAEPTSGRDEARSTPHVFVQNKCSQRVGDANVGTWSWLLLGMRVRALVGLEVPSGVTAPPCHWWQGLI